ncbi:MAG: hypothetical protein C7B46_19350 [Sulfobacillus benefaciens]|uniref:Uncharacterized protein n=1 Tax=Sulfobacillus benefaciens TaxID=453960 RepID=A0A2T2WZG2_9FIRM|nr:MAG: hypothetical protein C7B46_19350 [Sulfobacillus benefaciens]
MPTIDYNQQPWPALFFGFVNPRWAVDARHDAQGFLPPSATTPPSPWILTTHQTAGFACLHMVLAGVLVTADPFPLQPLVDQYTDSLLGMWDPVPPWDVLHTYAQHLHQEHLAMPQDTAYQWLQEAFLPVDPASLFKTSAAWPQARLWSPSGAPLDPWPRWRSWSQLADDLQKWDRAERAARYPGMSDVQRIQLSTPLVAAVVFENCD